MGDRKITLLELHFDGETQFGPSALPDVAGGSEESDEDLDVDVEGGSGGGAPVRGVLGLLALVIVVVLAKKLVGGSEGDEDEEFEG